MGGGGFTSLGETKRQGEEEEGGGTLGTER